MSRGVAVFVVVLFVCVMAWLYFKSPNPALVPAQPAQAVNWQADAGQGEPPPGQLQQLDPVTDAFARVIAAILAIVALGLVFVFFGAMFGMLR